MIPRDDDHIDDMEPLDVMYIDVKLKQQHVREALDGPNSKLSGIYGFYTVITHAGTTDARTAHNMDTAHAHAT